MSYPQDPVYQPGYFPPPPEYPKPDRTPWPWVIGVVLGLIGIAVIATGVLLVLQAHRGPSHAQQIVNWRDGAKDEMITLATDMTLIGDAAKTDDISGMRSACSLVAADIAPVQDKLPSPDADLNKALDAFLDDTHKGALACKQLSTYSDAKVAATFFQSGEQHLDKAGEIIRKAEADVKAAKE